MPLLKKGKRGPLGKFEGKKMGSVIIFSPFQQLSHYTLLYYRPLEKACSKGRHFYVATNKRDQALLQKVEVKIAL